MEIIKFSSQKEIQSDTCGSILEVINKKDFPFGIVVSEDIRSTKAHYHKKARKCYWMLKGWAILNIKNIKSEEETVVRLEEGDLITIEPFEKHKITKGSKKNRMITITSPAWHIEDTVSDF